MPEAFAAHDIATRLSAMAPSWTAGDGWIERHWATKDWSSAMLVASQVAAVCEQAWHHPRLIVEWGRVEVRLWSHDAGGVTERDLALAARLDAVVDWAPPTGGVLEGTPGGFTIAS